MKIVSLLALSCLALYACNTPDQQPKQAQQTEVIPLPSPADSVAAEPYLFTDPEGTVHLSWIHKAAGTGYLYFSTFGNNQWSAPKLVAQGKNWFINWADYPLMSSNGKGHLLAHFLEKSDSGTFTYDVRVTASADHGSTWSAPYTLHDDGAKAEHGFVSMTPYRDGYFVSWLDGRNTVMPAGMEHHEGHHGEMTLRGAVLDSLGKKVSEWELDNRVCDCCQTSVAITANGPVVIYRDRSAEEIRDISIVRWVDGKWTAPQSIFANNWKIEGCPVNGPRLDAIGNNLAIAWFSAPDKNAQVNVIFSGNGGAGFGKPVRVDQGKAAGRVDLVLLDESTAAVSWMEGPEIRVVKVHSDGTIENPVTISSTSESRSAGFPQMTRSGDGLVFAWTDAAGKTIRTAKLEW